MEEKQKEVNKKELTPKNQVQKKRSEDGLFTRFLWWCSGANLKILKDTPTEKSKFFGIGGAVFATWIMATLSGSYAFFTTFNNISFSVFFGIIWGLVIFNFDRFIVATMRKRSSGNDIKSKLRSFNNELLPALPRIILAALIGLTVSKPLELKLFENEIARELAMGRTIEQQSALKNLEDLYQNQLKAFEGEISMLEGQLIESKAHVKQLRQKFLDEMDGNPVTGSGKVGYSTIARIKEREFLKADSALKHYEIDANSRIEVLKQKRDLLLEQEQAYLKDFESIQPGFLARVNALSILSKKESAIWWTSFFITFLIIFIEIGPVLSKLLAARGPYDAKLELEEKMQLWEDEKRTILLKELIEHNFILKTEKEKEINEKQINQLSDVREQKISVQVQKWKDGELDVGFDSLSEMIQEDFHPHHGKF